MRYVKQYLSEKLKRGISAIRLAPKTVEEILKAKKKLSRQKLREILKNRGYKVLPMKKRAYKIVYKNNLWKDLRENYLKSRKTNPKARILIKNCHFSSRIKDKTISRKSRWIHYIREARDLLRSYKQKLGKQYQLYRCRVKGGLYRTDILGLKSLLAKL